MRRWKRSSSKWWMPSLSGVLCLRSRPVSTTLITSGYRTYSNVLLIRWDWEANSWLYLSTNTVQTVWPILEMKWILTLFLRRRLYRQWTLVSYVLQIEKLNVWNPNLQTMSCLNFKLLFIIHTLRQRWAPSLSLIIWNVTKMSYSNTMQTEFFTHLYVCPLDICSKENNVIFLK